MARAVVMHLVLVLKQLLQHICQDPGIELAQLCLRQPVGKGIVRPVAGVISQTMTQYSTTVLLAVLPAFKYAAYKLVQRFFVGLQGFHHVLHKPQALGERLIKATQA